MRQASVPRRRLQSLLCLAVQGRSQSELGGHITPSADNATLRIEETKLLKLAW